jgi:hypothetical protein
MAIANLVLAILLVGGAWYVVKVVLDASLRQPEQRSLAHRPPHRRTMITNRSGSAFAQYTDPASANPGTAIVIGLPARTGGRHA